MTNVFVVLVTYTVPLDRLMRTVPAHREYLDGFYQKGRILFSGMQSPPKGGVILMKAGSKEEVQQFIEQDPFYLESLATYEIVEFEVRRHQDFVSPWLETTS